MDDIYDDLDNYEDVNIVEELKKENHDLKLKLEEYTIAMSKLQKDFDKLSSDFKKLEMNYSSLLKTAKVEIERKTKIITDLNIEKDMIVLKAFQNRDVNDVRKLKNITKPFTKKPSNDSSFGKLKNNVPLADNNKGDSNNSSRKDDIRFSSVETTTTSGNTEIASKLMQLAHNSEHPELWSDRTSDTKENMTQRNKIVENNNTSSNTPALSIKNRRKSMPAVRPHTKYSSDEECEDRYCVNDANRISSRGDPNRQNIDKLQSDRHRYIELEERKKSSEVSNVDDNYYGYSGPTRDSYHRSKNDRHYGTDKHRSRHKYDISLRHKRHLSPERLRRAPRNDDYQRQKYGRHRVLTSPTPDKFQHYQPKPRNQDMRFKRDRDNTYESEKKDSNFDKYSSKHKPTSGHYDEPISKRQRTGSFNTFSEEEMRWSHERQLDKPVPDIYETLRQDLTCQSPDYNLTDAVSSHPVREIMNTASTPLEDPRIHSKRYIFKTSDDNVALTTVIGRNVDLKMLDASHWNNTSVEVPKPLTQRPPQRSEDIVREIYMGIDNPVSNMSTESGDILPFDVEDNIQNTHQSSIQKYGQNIEPNSANLPANNDYKNILTNYVIPKIKRSESKNIDNASRDVGVQSSGHKTAQPITNLKKDKNCLKSVHDSENKTPIEKENKSETPITKKYNDGNSSVYNEGNNRESISSMKELVAGDLELSDETSDNVEINKKYTTEKTQRKIKCSTDSEHKKDTTEHTQKNVTDKDIILDKHVEKEVIQEKQSDIVLDDCRKRHSKKKHSKNKESAKNSKADTTDREVDEKFQSKRDTKEPKEIKTKFSELFGDSSSLITPEDLGIMALQAQTQPSATYVPICEDAQDAVDVTVSNVKKVQTRLSKLKSLKPVKTQESLDSENNDNKTETKIKHTDKSSNDTKKKTRKNSAELTEKSKIREVYQNLTADKLVSEKIESSQNLEVNELVTEPKTDEPMVKQILTMVAQVPCTDVCKKPQFIDEQSVTAPNNDILQKTNIMMRALATSTPQKELKRDNSEIAEVAGGQVSSCLSSSKETSHDNVVGDKSSNNEKVVTPIDADVPDVRIFVKRKRRIKKSK